MLRICPCEWCQPQSQTHKGECLLCDKVVEGRQCVHFVDRPHDGGRGRRFVVSRVGCLRLCLCSISTSMSGTSLRTTSSHGYTPLEGGFSFSVFFRRTREAWWMGCIKVKRLAVNPWSDFLNRVCCWLWNWIGGCCATRCSGGQGNFGASRRLSHERLRTRLSIPSLQHLRSTRNCASSVVSRGLQFYAPGSSTIKQVAREEQRNWDT